LDYTFRQDVEAIRLLGEKWWLHEEYNWEIVENWMGIVNELLADLLPEHVVGEW